MSDFRPPNLPTYPNNPTKQISIREDGFSKPGTIGKSSASPAPASGKWKPALGAKFRPTAEKAQGRPRKRKLDPRHVTFY